MFSIQKVTWQVQLSRCEREIFLPDHHEPAVTLNPVYCQLNFSFRLYFFLVTVDIFL